ncbi:unnamed protein product [Cyprideis torosa]|uniref:Uncharacterized protein n=1 Tax=Cyprideis torosa TaxID=163714 RepID=A0A7R8WBZ9_9CRUS|nr:unnamed protein product [Cyprideis torosa]CAG0887001.1 unnamed protein product [Cyprideis torosa]
MELGTGDEAPTFNMEEIKTIILDAVENTLGQNSYNAGKMQQWTNSVTEKVLQQLAKLQKPFKYVVTCVIIQKTGGGVHTASTCFWDPTTDGVCNVRWDNKTMLCLVSVYGVTY